MNSPVRFANERSAPHASSCPDLQHAVRVATALVSDKWASPDTAYHAAMTAMGEELAPFLCAYGL
jgi:hypothetical protein